MSGSLGKLDGIMLLRYAHIHKDLSGGIETYLDNLNRMLLFRNKMTILQMYLADPEDYDVEVEEVGRGKLIWIPCRFLQHGKHAFKMKDLCALLLESGILKVPLRVLRYYRHRYILLQKGVFDCIRDYKIDMISFHWLNLDSEAIVASAVKNGIPYVFVNHFENSIFSRRIVRRQIANARGLAGVTGVNVPDPIRERFAHLFDGIDAEFYDPEHANHPDIKVRRPIVFMPSRIVEQKGHDDLIEVIARLRSHGTRVSLVFAGRTDSEKLFVRLKSRITDLGLDEDVMFLGLLDQESLRNWYAYCDLVVFPTQFMEGMGRVLLEAQAMKKPVIAYNAGGIPESIKDGETGFVIPKGDVQQLAERIADLLRDNRKRIQMGQRGRDFILNRFDLTGFAERHENFYLDTLRGHVI